MGTETHVIMGKEVKEEQNRLKGSVVSDTGISLWLWRKREQLHLSWQKMRSVCSSPTKSVAAESDALCPLVWKMPDLQLKQIFFSKIDSEK